jgi:hypothetical protein
MLNGDSLVRLARKSSFNAAGNMGPLRSKASRCSVKLSTAWARSLSRRAAWTERVSRVATSACNFSSAGLVGRCFSSSKIS